MMLTILETWKSPEPDNNEWDTIAIQTKPTGTHWGPTSNHHDDPPLTVGLLPSVA